MRERIGSGLVIGVLGGVTACQTLLGIDSNRPLVLLADAASPPAPAGDGAADVHQGGPGDATIEASPGPGVSDAGAGDAEGGLALAWNAYLPLFGGSASGGAPGVTPDVSGHGYAATYAHGLSFAGGRMIMAGEGDLSMPPESSAPAVDLAGSYSVSVWVAMTDTSGFRTFVSADGVQVSRFYLQKRNDSGYFAFSLTAADTNAAALAPCTASSAIAPSANALYHLVATRDATSGLDALYVNGIVAASATCTADGGMGWAAGTFGVGHGMYGGVNTDYVAGSISDLGLIDRVLTASEVQALYQRGPGSSDAGLSFGSPPADAGAGDVEAGARSDAGAATGPCDLYASGATPCVAAHSTVRALYGTYAGRLYQVRRLSDQVTADIGALSAGGVADSAAQDSFCAGTTCTISILYDQSPNGNDLKSAPGGSHVASTDSESIASALKVTVGGHSVYGIYLTPGAGYRNDATSGVPTGDQPETAYMVASGTHYNGGCCFDYGNAEVRNTANGPGHMEAVYLGSNGTWGTGSGAGPWVMVDLENGLFSGGALGVNVNDSSAHFDFVTAMMKGGAGRFAIKLGNAQSGGPVTAWDGPRPSGYATMSKEGAIVLGVGGDNSNSAAGTFFEGVMTSGYPSDTTDDAIQANIGAAGYAL